LLHLTYIIFTIFYSNILIFLKGNNNIADAKNNSRTEMDIYNENEEMITTNEMEVEDAMELDIESEEASEDEIEFYTNNETSEYERMIMEFDESNEEDGSDKEETSEEESDEEVIIDKPLSNEQMPRTSGEFAPYFKNITESLFFCWMQKHHICKLDLFKTYK